MSEHNRVPAFTLIHTLKYHVGNCVVGEKPMVKKLVVALIIFSMIVCVTGVVAKEDSSGGGSGSGGSSDDSSGNSGSETPHATDTPQVTETTRATETPGSDDSGSSGDSGSSSSDNSSSSGSDNSNSGRDNSTSSGSSSSRDAAEVEIEHGIITIKAHENERQSNLSSSSSGIAEPGRQSHDSAEIAAISLSALTSVQGSTSSQLAEHAKTIEDSLSHLSASENAIKTRNGIVIFFFGGDKSAASDIETHINEDRVALDKMDKIVNDPTTSPALKSFTQERVATIRAELERLQGIAEAEKQKRGLFG
jgi:hypothetical protein